MNNEAFRKLVNENGVGKSTKEIAREAVEEEFKRRRKGRKKEYLSDDDDDEEDDGANRKRKRDFVKEGSSDHIVTVKNTKLKAPQYRDRAKERREGKALDYDSLYNTEHVDNEMSKYLGGDESYTHLVKGLDTALAEKVRRLEKGMLHSLERDVDLDELMDEAISKKSDSYSSSSKLILKTFDETQKDSITPFVKGMVSYLNGLMAPKVHHSDISPLNNHMPQTGQKVARSILKFSTKANVGDRMRSWELPQETIYSFQEYNKMAKSVSRIKSATPLDSNLISKLKTVFATKSNDMTHKSAIIESGLDVHGKSVSQESDEDIFSD